MPVGLQIVIRLRPLGPGQHLLAHQRQEPLDRMARLALGQAMLPAVAGQDGRGHQDRLQIVGRGLIAHDQILVAPTHAARPAGAALGAQDPAPQLGGRQRRQLGGKGAVRRLEQVMALVEHVAGRQDGIFETAHGGLDQHQRVVGDDDVGPARAADRMFDEAARIMRAAGIDAFAAAVGQTQSLRAADDIDQPAGEIAADQRAVLGRHGPACHQAQADRMGRVAQHGLRRLFEIQQAKIILAALAQHDLERLLLRVGIEPVQLAVDLGLQVAGEGRDPDRAAVALGPEAGRRQIAQRLADAGPGLGQHQIGLVRRLFRREGGADRRGVIRLLRPGLGGLGARAAMARPALDQVGQPGARVGRIDRVMAGWVDRTRLLPFRQARPDVEAREPARPSRQRGGAQGRQHRRAPGPVTGHHQLRQFGQDRRRGLGDAVEQDRHRIGQAHGLVFERTRAAQAQGTHQPARRRQAELPRAGEGEQLERVEGAQLAQIEPPRRRAAVGQQRRLVAHPPDGGLEIDRIDLAIGRQPDGVPGAEHQHRDFRRQDAGRLRRGGRHGDGMHGRGDYRTREPPSGKPPHARQGGNLGSPAPANPLHGGN